MMPAIASTGGALFINVIFPHSPVLFSQEMMDAIELEAKSDHSNYDCFACAVLTHGGRGIFYGVDGETVSAKAFKNAVNGSNCKSLVGKPKLFIIQACRGGELLSIRYDNILCVFWLSFKIQPGE